MGKRYQRGVWWVKRDFRLSDNEALLKALDECETVLAVFIIEPALCWASETSYLHYHAWKQAASCLADSLSSRGGHLSIWQGEATAVLRRLHEKDGFDALFSHQETGSAVTFKRDKHVKAWLKTAGISWHEQTQNGVIRGLTDRGKRQTIIRQRLLESKPNPKPPRIAQWRSEISDDPWPEFHAVAGRPLDSRISIKALQRVTETDALQTLNNFLQHRGISYSGGISSPNTAFEAGSRLSVHLAWGTISLRQVFHAVSERLRELQSIGGNNTVQWRKSLKAFSSRLHWHDHFMQRLESAPAMEFESLNPAYKTLCYGDNQTLLQAWMDGRTGLPIVDACMRCLAATGFLNFRMRAMLVTTGVFGLAQSWQSLQYPLARVFRDYEPGIHFSQIQMQAGIVGINTVRIYSPYKQLLDQDPDAKFVKRWIPELSEFAASDIACYESRSLGDYPPPITDIKHNTRVIRDQVYAIRGSDVGVQASAKVLDKHGSRLTARDRINPLSKRVARQDETEHSPAQMTLNLED